MRMQRWVFIIAAGTLALQAKAQDPEEFDPGASSASEQVGVQPQAKAGRKDPRRKEEVLDFEADVIEGQKKAPELFLQLDVQKPDLSSVLFERKHFNDFHAVDSKRRPRLSDPRVTK